MSDMESDDQSLREYQEREYYEQEEVQELIKENGRLRAGLRAAHDELMNLQPHIGQLEAHQRPFIDAHVDVAMEKMKEALGEDE